MKWYLIKDVNDCKSSIIEYFNSFGDMEAFVPRTMKFFSTSGNRCIIPQPWNDSYIIVKTNLKYGDVFSRYWNLVQENSFQFRPDEDVIKFRKEETSVLSHLFENNDIVACSIGNIVNGKLIVEKGPLKGLEDHIKKIDRHKRIAFLNINNELTILKVYLEVVSKS